MSVGALRLGYDREAGKAPDVSFPAAVPSTPSGASAPSDPPRAAPSPSGPAIGLQDSDILLYLEAITQIRDKAIRLRPDVTRAQIVDQSLRAYLTQRDPCCAYLTRDEYRRFKESLNESYVGIGMEITQDREGRTICLPHPEGPAARAGIARGSALRSIDGVAVDGKSIFSLAAMARGRPGTEVRMAVTTRDGKEREFRVTRSPVTSRAWRRVRWMEAPSSCSRTLPGTPDRG